jgi:hypothetical protein
MRLRCGASGERFDLLRRLTLGNIAFVASMPLAVAGAVPVISGDWWRSFVARGWQLRLTAGEIVVVAGRAKWRGGGAGGGGRHYVSATVLVAQGAGFCLGSERSVDEGMVAEAGVFVDWDAAKFLFLPREQPLLYSEGVALMKALANQALPPLPHDTDSPSRADGLDVLVVLPLKALPACAADGHSPQKHGLSEVMWVLDEPIPRAIRKAYYTCVTCKKSPVGPDGLHTRRFRKVPTLIDVNEYFRNVDGMGIVFLAGQTYYTIWFLLALASHFCLRPQVTELASWLAERWGFACLGMSRNTDVWQRDWPHRQIGEGRSAGELPWIMDALRGSDVLMGLVERFVSCFLDGLC